VGVGVLRIWTDVSVFKDGMELLILTTIRELLMHLGRVLEMRIPHYSVASGASIHHARAGYP